ncbi:hypothetical protein P8935_07250 [Telmatobacter sp. DSM 110680]|uniref:Uncharacterized protein n=1 Tax=Telmatobacter sp. DSM 110680 TaxID=3036704 RepID=A0AAU7DP85_9BACT
MTHSLDASRPNDTITLLKRAARMFEATPSDTGVGVAMLDEREQ